jgi:hypothetical protein
VEIYEQAFAAMCVLLLLGGLVLVLRKQPGLAAWRGWGRTPSEGVLTVVGRVALSPQHHVHVLEMAGRRILVGTHPSGISFGPEGSEFSTVLSSVRGVPPGGAS